jgi:hypothetical protein
MTGRASKEYSSHLDHEIQSEDGNYSDVKGRSFGGDYTGRDLQTARTGYDQPNLLTETREFLQKNVEMKTTMTTSIRNILRR